MKTPSMKMPLYLSLHTVAAVTNTSFKKMKTPLYLSLMGVVALTNTSFKKAKAINFRTVTRNTYSVIIVKSKYELKIIDSTGEWIVTYPVVFGNKDLGDKLMQGDRRTPEGIFHILNKRKHQKWDSFMLIDYPNQESYQKFNARKAKGAIPADAQIGGAIGIHGTWHMKSLRLTNIKTGQKGVSVPRMFI